jgi:cytochrome c
MLSQRNSRIAVAAAVVLLLVGGAGVTREYCHEKAQLRDRAEAITGGNAAHGRQLFVAFGCGGCHSVSGVPQAHGLVGPPLDAIGTRAMIAGKLQNTPANLQHWIEDPQAVTPGTAMPRLGVGDGQARDLAAFLYTR